MDRPVRKLMEAASFGMAALAIPYAWAQTPCTKIQFVAGSTSTLIRGAAPAGGSPVCYTLAAKKLQHATLKVIGGVERIVFKIDDPVFDRADDALRVSTFHTSQKLYRIIVYDEENGVSAIPFTLFVSLK